MIDFILGIIISVGIKLIFKDNEIFFIFIDMIRKSFRLIHGPFHHSLEHSNATPLKVQ